MNGFLEIEAEIQKRRAQCDGVKGKDTPYRTEFRYRGGTKHWQYFVTLYDAQSATDTSCRYRPVAGSAIIEQPLSQQVQVRGPRGGWRKL